MRRFVKTIAILVLGVACAVAQNVQNTNIRGLKNRVFNVIDYGATGDNSHDDTTHIQAALNAAMPVKGEVVLPRGTFKITSKLTACSAHAYASIRGSGEGTVIAPSTSFPETTTDAASAAINTDCGINYPTYNTSVGPQIRDLKITFTQSFAGANRLTLKKWTALNLNNTLNPVVENVTIERAWNGISFKGTWNSGTSTWDGVVGRGYFANLGINAYNIGVEIDGMTDSSRFIGVHLWPYGGDFSAWWYDPAAIGYQIGRADDLSITNGLGITGTHFNFVAGADGNGGYTKITGYGFDGHQGILMPDSGFTGSAGHTVLVSNSTASFDGSASGGAAARFIKYARGSLNWSGGYISALLFTGPVIEIDNSSTTTSMVAFDNVGFANNNITGVKYIQQVNNASTDFLTVSFRNCNFFAYASQNDTAPYVSIEQADAGARFQFTGNVFSPTGPTYVRAAVAVTTDALHYMTGNSFSDQSGTQKWSVSYPAAHTLGQYQPTQANTEYGKTFHLPVVGNSLTLYGPNPILQFTDTTGAADYSQISHDATAQYFDLFQVGTWNWRGPAYAAAMSLTTTGALYNLKEIQLLSGAEGTCDVTNRGRIVMVQGGLGVADTFRICAKDAANNYAWTALY